MRFASSLSTWYRRYGRTLPWRANRRPYPVWIAEVMAQQTRVATVIPYFLRWQQQFPTLAHLALAREEEVLSCWEGLGYYRRARNLLRCADTVMTRYQGQLPGSSAELLTLPGIGPYTAAAVASIAFGEQIVAVDANIRRIASRYFALPDPKPAEVATRLGPHQPHDAAGDFNEALMDLGAIVCRPRAPDCPRCPLRAGCLAQQRGQAAKFPRRKGTKPPPLRLRYALIFTDGHEVFLRRRRSNGLLGGMWGFAQVARQPPGTALDPVHHAYTHFQLALVPVVVTRDTLEQLAPDAAGYTAEKIAMLPLSVVDRKVLASIEHRLLASPTGDRRSSGTEPGPSGAVLAEPLGPRRDV